MKNYRFVWDDEDRHHNHVRLVRTYPTGKTAEKIGLPLPFRIYSKYTEWPNNDSILKNKLLDLSKDDWEAFVMMEILDET